MKTPKPMTGTFSGVIEYLDCQPNPNQALTVLSPPLQQWFRDVFGAPTSDQCYAWPTIAAGKNLLLASPTGTGKTLAAFLLVLDNLLSTHNIGWSPMPLPVSSQGPLGRHSP
jgi:superfamily II DNA/RNA helicase